MLVVMVEVRKEWLERGDPHPLWCSAPHRISPQNSKGTSVALRYCILCHHPESSNLGVPQIGTLGRSILPPLLPQQKWLPAGVKGGGSIPQRRLGWAGGPGRGQGTVTGSCRGRLAAPWWVQRPDGQSREGSGGGHRSLRPTHHTVQRDAEGLGNLSSSPLAPALSGGEMHPVPHGEGWVRAGTPAQAATLDAG